MPELSYERSRTRWFLAMLCLIAMSSLVMPVEAAPRRKKRAPKPLTPAQLRGQIAYVQNADVWVVNPLTRVKTLLFKNLFYSPKSPPTDEYFGGTVTFGAHSVDISPDCTRVAFTFYVSKKAGNEMMVMDINGKNRRQITDTKFEYVVNRPQWSPDGKKLLFRSGSAYRSGGPGYGSVGIDLIDVDSKRRVLPAFGRPSNYDAYWSRDGKSLLYTHFPGSLDYMGESQESPTLQTIQLDNSNIQKFDGDWSRYNVPNSTRDGIRYEAIYSSSSNSRVPLWKADKPDSDLNKLPLVFGREVMGIDNFGVEAFSFPAEGPFFAVQGNWQELKVYAEGMAFPNLRWGVFLLKRGEYNYRRLLAPNAVLVGWL